MNQITRSNSPDTRNGIDDNQQTPGHDGASMSQPDDAVQRAIGARLRAAYDEMVSLPVPDRFLDLLSTLDGKITASQKADGDGES